MVWAARAIPTVLIGIIGYVSWVDTRVVVCKTSFASIGHCDLSDFGNER